MPQSATSQRLNLAQILPLTLTGFLAIMTETMPVGMLANISETLQVSQSLAGQLVAVYAIGSFMAAVPIIALTRGINRKTLLLLALAVFFLANLATSFTVNFYLLLAQRFLAGVAAAVAWGLLAGYTIRLAPADKQGQAIAIMGIGQPIALAIGVPVAAYLATVFAWQNTFILVALVALIAFIWVALLLPGFAGESHQQRKSLVSIVMQRQILAVLAILFCWVGAHNLMYTYISPYLSYAGFSLSLDVSLLNFGIFSIFGIIATSIFVDKYLAKTSLIAALLFILAAALFLVGQGHFGLISLAIALWGLAFGGVPTLLTKHMANVAGADVDVAQSFFVTIFNGAIFFGAASGGIILTLGGAFYVPLCMLLLAGLTAVILLKFLQAREKAE